MLLGSVFPLIHLDGYCLYQATVLESRVIVM